MLETYKGTLHGNKITWEGKTPDAVRDDIAVEVEVKIISKVNGSKSLRPIGLAKGEFSVPDDFDSPLPDDVLNDFEN